MKSLWHLVSFLFLQVIVVTKGANLSANEDDLIQSGRLRGGTGSEKKAVIVVGGEVGNPPFNFRREIQEDDLSENLERGAEEEEEKIKKFQPAVNEQGYVIDYCCNYEVLKLSTTTIQNLKEEREEKGPGERNGKREEVLAPSVKRLPVKLALEEEVPLQRGYGCGKEAADKFCQLNGYEESSRYDVIYYSHQPTYIVGEGRIQEKDNSMGLGHRTFFNFIECKKIPKNYFNF